MVCGRWGVFLERVVVVMSDGRSSSQAGGHHLFPATPPEPVEGARVCAYCGTSFDLRYAFQQVALRSEERFVCSRACRQGLLDGVQRTSASGKVPCRIAVLNQKGGTGKTTTAVNLAAGLADAGHRVLLVDMDAQGHVGISLGVRGARTIYDLLVEGAPLDQCVVPVSDSLHLVTSNATLASAEIYLARKEDRRHLLLRDKLAAATEYDFVLLDCGPSLSLLNLNALSFADYLLVPVSCDFLAMVGVRQVMKTLNHVNRMLLHPVQLMGVLPTFYDQRNRISDESVKSLRSHFKDKVLHPIRINTRLKEAPSYRQSIFEYSPQSRGAEDYRRLVRWVQQFASQQAQGVQHGQVSAL